MRPVLFHLSALDAPVFAYGFMLGLAIVVGLNLAAHLARQRGMRAGEFWPGAGLTVLLALLGSRILYVVTHPSLLARPLQWLDVGAGGLVAYGGFLGGVLGARLAFGREGFLAAADLMAPSVALGTALTRVGCFLNGCDYGIPTQLPWGVRFPRDRAFGDLVGPSPAWLAHLRSGISLEGVTVDPTSAWSLPVHPTQLYEAGLGLALFVFLLARWKRGARDGSLFLGWVGLYGLGRAAIEVRPGRSSARRAVRLAGLGPRHRRDGRRRLGPPATASGRPEGHPPHLTSAILTTAPDACD